MLPRGVRVYAYREPVDLRKSFDGLALIAKEHLGSDPQSGSLYCFVNKRKNRIKILWWDQTGFCLLYKRLSGARFVLPNSNKSLEPSQSLDGSELARLIKGVVFKKDKRFC